MEGSDRRILNVIPIAADDRGGKIVKASGRDGELSTYSGEAALMSIAQTLGC